MRATGYGAGMGASLTPAVKNLILANVGVFVVQTLTGIGARGYLDPVTQYLSFIPQLAIHELQVWRFFTYMFLHGGMFHLLFNMFALWMFGAQIERLWGSRTFLLYYFICGLGGSVTYGLFNLNAAGNDIMLGASGAVYGILLAFGMTFPEAYILMFMIIPMKAKYAVILFGLIELLSIPRGGSVAHLAHLGGMVAGFLFLRLTAPGLARTGRGLSDLGGIWRRTRTRRRIKIVTPPGRDQGEPRGPSGFGRGDTTDPKSTGPKSADQQEIDRILDKISRHGLQSLSDDEQEILRRAGRR